MSPTPTSESPATAPTDAPGSADRGGELSFGVGMVMSSLDPHNERHEGERVYTFAIYDRLTQLDQSLTPEPMIATEWEFSDDLLSLTLTLRDDVTFHDGTPLDAEAVRANLERARDPEQATVANQLAAIDTVTVVSPTEIEISLTEPAADLPARLAGPAGALISPNAFEEGRDLGLDPGMSGSGLYVVADFTPSETIAFVPAPDEPWDETARQLDRLEFSFMPDPRTREAAFQTGEIDVSMVSTTPDDLASAERITESGDFQMVRVQTGSVSALLLRSKVAPVDDLAIRQAVSQAIDRDAIVNNLLQGTCTATAQLFPEGWSGHIADFEEPYPYDVEAARASIEEVGGLSAPLEILTIAGSGVSPVPEAVRSQLTAAGIDATITPLAAVEALTRFRTDAGPAWLFEFLNTVDPAASVADGVLGSQLGVDSPDVREALTAAQQVVDPAERAAALEDLASVVLDGAFMVPLCFGDAVYLALDSVVGLEESIVPYNRYMIDVRHIGRSDG